MAKRPNKNTTKKPLPKPERIGDEETLDQIEELLFEIQQERKAAEAAKSTPQPQPRQRQRARSARKQPRNSPAPTTQPAQTAQPTQAQTNKNCLNCCKDMLGMLSIINDSASKVLNVLKAEHLLGKKQVEQFKKDNEERERREKENLLESTGKKLSNTMQRAFAPIKSAMEAMFKFILYTLAGRAVGKILKWFSDPANEKKVNTLARFLKDWWPGLLGAFVLFGTRFGAGIRASVKAIVSTVLYLKKIGIPGIISGIKSASKLGLAAAGLAGAGVLAYNLTKSKEEKKPENPQNKTGQYSGGGMVPRINFFAPQETNVREIAYAEGGHIDDNSGIRITGAGPDTQLIAAQPGEIVMSKAAVDKFGADTFLRMNLMAGANNRPKFAGNIQFAQQGGIVGGLKSLGSNLLKGFQKSTPQINKPAKAINSYSMPSLPRISSADYNALLAIAAAEDADPQGRADVAQSIYNRLFAGSSYGMNFMPTGGKNTIKNIITGEGQYEPTFKNRQDWLKIKDRESAALALSNAKGIDMSMAMKMLTETEKALRNSQLQSNAQQHVGGRPSFFGTSQMKNMRGDDVLRYDTIKGKRVPRKDNFFTHYPAEDSKYRKDRGNIAAPIPQQLYSPRNTDQSSLPTKKYDLMATAPAIRVPGPRPRNQSNVVELPPIDLRKTKNSNTMNPSSTEVPEFSVIASRSDRYGEKGTLAILGIEA